MLSALAARSDRATAIKARSAADTRYVAESRTKAAPMMLDRAATSRPAAG